MGKWAPNRKVGVGAGTIGVPMATLIAWALNEFAGVTMPQEVAMALGAVIATIFAYLVPEQAIQKGLAVKKPLMILFLVAFLAADVSACCFARARARRIARRHARTAAACVQQVECAKPVEPTCAGATATVVVPAVTYVPRRVFVPRVRRATVCTVNCH